MSVFARKRSASTLFFISLYRLAAVAISLWSTPLVVFSNACSTNTVSRVFYAINSPIRRTPVLDQFDSTRPHRLRQHFVCRKGILPLLHSLQVGSELVLDILRQRQVSFYGRTAHELKFLHPSYPRPRRCKIMTQATTDTAS
jgi:hypothetical protein